MTNPQCIHIPDGSVVVSGELFDMACAAINERDKLIAEVERLDKKCGALAYLQYGSAGPDDPWQAKMDEVTKPLHAEIERLREVLTIPNITPDTKSSALFIRTLSEHEKGQPVNAQDLINALMWRVKNQRKEIAQLQKKRGSSEPGVGAPFPYPTDRDGWICSICHGWNGPKTRVCLHSHVPLDPQGASRDAQSVTPVPGYRVFDEVSDVPAEAWSASRDASSDGTCPVCGFPKGHCHIGCTAPPPAPPGVHYHTFKYIGNSPQSGNQMYQCETCGYRILETNAQRTGAVE